ncbi:MAG: tyrosine-type recombinase/integrase [Burkholderiaceae bacterium]
MRLTSTFVKNVKHSGVPSGDKYRDGAGMYLLVNSSGKYWRLDYRFANKRKTYALGVYPLVSLAKARQRREIAREQLSDGVDPGLAKRDEKLAKALTASNTYELVAQEFHRSKSDSWSASYAAKWLRGQEKDLFPYIGALPIATITAPTLLSTLRRVESRGAIESAHTLRQTAGQVFM